MPARLPAGLLGVQSFTPSDGFYIACGTATLDVARSKALVIFDRATQQYQLPKGRKDWGEALEGTALRETFEETGSAARLLPLPLPTRSTPPRASGIPVPAGDVTRGIALTEPIALTMLHQASGALAVVLWYVARANSAQQLEQDTQMADEDYDALWLDYDDALRRMGGSDFGKVLRRAVELVRHSPSNKAGPEPDGLVTGCGNGLQNERQFMNGAEMVAAASN